MKTIYAIGFIALILASCKSGAKKSADKKGTTVVSNQSKDSMHKYGIKSGIITQEVEAMGMKLNPVIYFDDYGAEECSETTMEMMGFKSDHRNLQKNGYAYDIDMIKKTCTKHKLYTPTSANINFMHMADQMKKKMNLKVLGTEEYLGKKCTRYAIDYKEMNMKGVYLVYENIPMQMDVSIGKLTTKLKVTKFEENVPIPSDRFEVPSDIPITDGDISTAK